MPRCAAPSRTTTRCAARASEAIAAAQPADVVLHRVAETEADFRVDGTPVTTGLKLRGVYNIFNAAAALTFARHDPGRQGGLGPRCSTSLSNVEPAFGRGESLTVNGAPLELVLVKNPTGFRLGLKSFAAHGYATMIAINDNYADGRDMSWLWDVDFETLSGGVDMVTGVRAYDMALRLRYDDVPVREVIPDIPDALAKFIAGAGTQPMRIFCTYTAMLAVRRELSKITKVEVVS